jgi:hypothetical protein
MVNVIFCGAFYQKSLQREVLTTRQREVLTTRLDWIKGATSAMVFSLALGVSPSRAALQGLALRPPEGNCNGCLGVINGLLAPCDTVSDGDRVICRCESGCVTPHATACCGPHSGDQLCEQPG